MQSPYRVPSGHVNHRNHGSNILLHEQLIAHLLRSLRNLFQPPV